MSVQPLRAVIEAGTEGPEVEAFKLLQLFETREAWLNAAVAFFGPLFEEAGAPLPGRVRVSIGFCSTGRKSRRIGECWDSSASGDQHVEIFIKPEIDGAMTALEILGHELCHAAVGVQHGHKAPFKRVAVALGLVGKMTSTTAGPALLAKLEKMHSKLGAFPYAPLTGANNGRKKVATRLVKCACQECGYTVRTTRKWLDEAGAPICPACMEPMAENGKGESEGE